MSNWSIQTKSLGIRSKTFVKNEHGQTIYMIVGRWGVQGDALLLYNMNGDLVAKIKQIRFPFGARFIIYEHDQKVGTLTKIFQWPTDFYYVKQLHWQVFGNIKKQHYQIQHFNQLIMAMSTIQTSEGPTYLLNIPDEENVAKCICIAAVMDYWVYHQQKSEQPTLHQQFLATETY